MSWLQHSRMLTIAFLFTIYSITPTFIVYLAGDGTGRMLPCDAQNTTLANVTFHIPGIEEMDGDFHHHDKQGNDLIRVMKKYAITKAGIDLHAAATADILLLNHVFAHIGELGRFSPDCLLDADTLQSLHGFSSEKTGHSPPFSGILGTV